MCIKIKILFNFDHKNILDFLPLFFLNFVSQFKKYNSEIYFRKPQETIIGFISDIYYNYLEFSDRYKEKIWN